jgi:hypothetical protein
MRIGVVLAVLTPLLAAPTSGVLEAQARRDSTPPMTAPELRPMAPPAMPFEAGERLTYKVKLGVFNVGEGHMTVHGVEEVRGVPTYHVSMDLDGSAMFGAVRVRDRFHSWMDIRTLATRRFIKDIHEVNYKSVRSYEIYPEEKRWERNDHDEEGVSLSHLPLDEIAFVYFVRTLPLEVGQTYTYDRYFKEDGNPVVLKVLRKERKKVDAGTFDTVVVQPLIRTSGLFSEGGKAELYFTDDEHRHLIYMRSEIPVVGSITLHLRSVEQGYTPESGGG